MVRILKFMEITELPDMFGTVFLPSAKPHGQHVVFQVRRRRRMREGGREGYFKKPVSPNPLNISPSL